MHTGEEMDWSSDLGKIVSYLLPGTLPAILSGIFALWVNSKLNGQFKSQKEQIETQFNSQEERLEKQFNSQEERLEKQFNSQENRLFRENLVKFVQENRDFLVRIEQFEQKFKQENEQFERQLRAQEAIIIKQSLFAKKIEFVDDLKVQASRAKKGIEALWGNLQHHQPNPANPNPKLLIDIATALREADSFFTHTHELPEKSDTEEIDIALCKKLESAIVKFLVGIDVDEESLSFVDKLKELLDEIVEVEKKLQSHLTDFRTRALNTDFPNRLPVKI
jgi:hypothetical protein